MRQRVILLVFSHKTLSSNTPSEYKHLSHPLSPHQPALAAHQDGEWRQTLHQNQAFIYLWNRGTQPRGDGESVGRVSYIRVKNKDDGQVSYQQYWV